MLKKLLAAILALISFGLYLLLPSKILAENDFFIDSLVTYEFDDQALAHVIHQITLENKESTLYAKSYLLSFENINPENISVVDNNGNNYLFSSETVDNSNTIKIEFPDDLIGKGNQRIFYVNFESKAFSQRYGEIVEINIPKLNNPESFRDYLVKIFIPPSFNNKAYISPNPGNEEYLGQKRLYWFNKQLLTKSSVSAAFGNFQVFDFTFHYHLENPLNKLAETEIAIPPDTAFQKIYYQNITPQPLEINSDEDGNWLAKYLLNPRQKLDIKAEGIVKIFSKEVLFKQPNQEYLASTLREREYWEVNNPVIIDIAKNLKTPKAVYDFVVNKLNYDYQRVKPNTERLGALAALNNPDQAICTEFTDLFITLCRASGIPAREINGYAYADDPKIQPMSLVADVLHAWPEYWNIERSVWVPVDPTWGKTTQGTDFFNKLDLRHFTFVIHGLDSGKPYPPGSYKLGDNPQKDIYITFGKLAENKSQNYKLEHILPKNPFWNNKIKINITNENGYSVSRESLKIFFDSQEKYNLSLPYFLPYSSQTIDIDYPFSFLGKSSPDTINIVFANQSDTIINVRSTAIVLSLIGLFLIIILLFIVLLLFVKRKKIILALNTRLGGLFKVK